MFVNLRKKKNKGNILIFTFLICLFLITILLFCLDSVGYELRTTINEKDNIKLNEVSLLTQKEGLSRIRKWINDYEKIPSHDDLKNINFAFDEDEFQCQVVYEDNAENFIIQTIVNSLNNKTKKITNVCIDRNILSSFSNFIEKMKYYSFISSDNGKNNTTSIIKNLKTDGKIYIGSNVTYIFGAMDVGETIEIKCNSLKVNCEAYKFKAINGIFLDALSKYYLNKQPSNVSNTNLCNVYIPTFYSDNKTMDMIDNSSIYYITSQSAILKDSIDEINNFYNKQSDLIKSTNFNDILKVIIVNGDLSVSTVNLNNSILIVKGKITLCGANNFNCSYITCNNFQMTDENQTYISKLNNFDLIATKIKHFLSSKLSQEYKNNNIKITDMYNEGF